MEAQELTLQGGAKYVVRADASHIVLRKEVDGKALAVRAADLPGKAVLIYPLAGAAEDGVFSWARSVQDSGDTLEITAEPLGLDELATLREEQVVRIFMDRTLSKATAATPGAPAARNEGVYFLPPAEGAGTRPLGMGAPILAGTPLDVQSFGFGSVPSFLGSVSPHITQFKINPDLLFDNKNGLELGARLDFSTDVTLALHGVSRSTTSLPFLSFEKQLASRWFVMPVAGIPIPFKVALAVGISCGAVPGVTIDTELRFKVDLHTSASFVFDPRGSDNASQWIHGGSWPNELTAHASMDSGKIHPSLGLTCEFPRLKLSISPVGNVAGVYLVAGTGVTAPITEDLPPVLWAEVSAGAWGKIFGKTARTEYVLKRWSL